jgi:hypothetical protein
VVFPHTMPDGRLVNLYGRAVGTAEQVPKATRHDHLPGAKSYFNATALQTGLEPLWVCEGAFDALALLAAGVSRVVAIFGVQGWRWAWAREVRELVFALDADTAGQQQWRTLVWQAALQGKCVAVLPPEAYGGLKDISEAWVAGTLAVGAWSNTSKGNRSAARRPCGSPRGLGGARCDHARGRSSSARRRHTAGLGGTPALAGGVVTPGTTISTGHGPPAHAQARPSARYGASWNEQS